MPPDPAGHAPGGGQPRDLQLTKQERARLPAAMAELLPTEQATLDFLERQMGIPAASIPGFRHGSSPQDYEAPEQYWDRLLVEFDAKRIIEIPWRRLFTAVTLTKTHSDQVHGIFQRFLVTGSEVSPAAIPGVNGCHAIVLTTDEQVRSAVRDWLEEVGLAPLEVWANHDMTSFEVISPDAGEVANQIRSRYPQLLVKVISPGEPDTTLTWLEVHDGGDLELHVPDVPVQLTFEEFGESAARFHPAEASRRAKHSDGEDRTEFAHHSGPGLYQQVPVARTLLRAGASDGDQVTIGSVRFEEIRVVFVGASPLWNGQEHVGEARSKQELSEIKRMARLRHIRLVGEFQHATRADLPDILALKPDIVHVSCHGKGRELYCEDDDGDSDAVRAEWLAENILERARRRLSGILLSACEGESVGPPFTVAARAVIAHPGLLPGNLAADFTAEFYHELSRMPVLRTAAKRAAESVGCNVLIFPDDEQGAI
jgi:hypothetical protein